MFTKLTQKQQQWIAIGLLAVVTAVFLLITIVPLQTVFYENQDEIEKLTMQLERYQKIAASREETLEQSALAKEKIKELNVFSAKNSSALALADMQEKIKNTITQAKGELISTQNLVIKQKQTDDATTKIGINIRFSGRIETLKNILYEFESARPAMIIENIKITGVRGLRNITTGKIDPIDKVDVSMDIVSFLAASEQ